MNNENNGDEIKKEFETLNNGVDVEIVYISGLKEIVKVRKVPIREMQSLARAWGQEDKEIQVYTMRPEEWLQTLTDDSWTFIMEEGRRLNAVPFAKWFARQAAALEAMGQTTAIRGIMEQAMAEARR